MSIYQNKVAFFEKAEIDETVKRVYYTSHRPNAEIKSGAVVEFAIDSSSRDLTDLSQSMLYMKMKVVKEDGTSMSTDEVTTANLPLHSFWRQAELLINETNLSRNIGPSYPYKAYFQVLIDRQKEPGDTQLQSELFFLDDEPFDDPKPSGNYFVFTQKFEILLKNYNIYI